MIKSKFVSDIIELLLDGEEDNMAMLKEQVHFINDTKYDFTGSGVLVYFTFGNEIIQYKSEKENEVISGVEIESTDLTYGAHAIIFVKSGLLNYLEVWSKDNEYPKRELVDYELKQVWQDSKGRIIKSI